jgi:hypothetical protein
MSIPYYVLRCNRVELQESVLDRKGEINLEESSRSNVGSLKFE